MSTCPYGEFDMDIWAFRHTGIDIRTCCRDAGYDYIHCNENSDREYSKYKKHLEFAGIFRRLFTVDVLLH